MQPCSQVTEIKPVSAVLFRAKVSDGLYHFGNAILGTMVSLKEQRRFNAEASSACGAEKLREAKKIELKKSKEVAMETTQ